MEVWLFLIVFGVLAYAASALKRALARCPHGTRRRKPCLLCEEERLRQEQLRQVALHRHAERERELAIAHEAERAQAKEAEFRRLRDISALEKIDPYSFEILCAHLYEQMGWSAETTPKTGDGGVDVFISRQGETKVVQCKRLTGGKVGVGVLRDLFGVITATRASGGILVTTGTFTDGAIAWAKDKRIELVDGTHLSSLIRQHLTASTLLPDAYIEERASAQRIDAALARLKQLLETPCPRCGKPLAIRKGRHGKFIGCTGYPSCRQTSNIPEYMPADRLNRMAQSTRKQRYPRRGGRSEE